MMPRSDEELQALADQIRSDPKALEALMGRLEKLISDKRRTGPIGIVRGERGQTLAIPQMALMRSEHLDPSTEVGLVNNAFLLAAGPGRAAVQLGIAGTKGVVPFLSTAGGMIKRAAVGAGIGGLLGMTPIPIVGGGGFKEGAQLGALVSTGQKGKGALWKHGKKVGLLKWLQKKLGSGAASRQVVEEAVDDAVSKAARQGMSTSGAGRVVPISTGRGTTGAASTTAVPSRAPAPSGPVPKGTSPYANLSQQEMVDLARFLRRSSSAERKALQDWLKTQTPEVAKEVRKLLKQGHSKMGTVYKKPKTV